MSKNNASFTGWWTRAWHEDTVFHSRLTALRWVIFGLIAFDLWSVMLMHAARFGAGGFNVAQVEILDTLLPTPTPEFISAGMMLAGLFALYGAVGLGTRLSMGLATLLYFGIYMWSQSDSYQHHYLVALLMAIACFLPQRSWTDDSLTPSERWHWGIRLLYVQVALVYMWTAVTKCDATWLSGQTMNQLTNVPEIRDLITGLEQSWTMKSESLYALIAWLTMLGEFFAGLVFLVPRLRLIGLFIVPWFHVSVEVLGFDIEWFSYYMLGINFVLLTPAGLWRRMDAYHHRLGQRIGLARLNVTKRSLQWCLFVAAVVSVGVVLKALPFNLTAIIVAQDHSVTTTQLVLGLMVLYTAIVLRPNTESVRRLTHYACAPLAAYACVWTIQTADSAYDFYRMWGGDLKRRGEIAEAIERYEEANKLHPDTPARRRQLGALYAREGNTNRAKTLYQEAADIMGIHLNREAAQLKGANVSTSDIIAHIDNHLRQESNCQALSKVLGYASDAASARAEAETCRDDALMSAIHRLERLKKDQSGYIQGFSKARKWTTRAFRNTQKDQQAFVHKLSQTPQIDAHAIILRFDETIRLWDRCLLGESNSVLALSHRERRRFAQCADNQAAAAAGLERQYSTHADASSSERTRMTRAIFARKR